jgi:hypothetical protein
MAAAGVVSTVVEAVASTAVVDIDNKRKQSAL